MNERLLHLECRYMELDQCRMEAGNPAPSLSEAMEAVVGAMADVSGGGAAGTAARLRVLERELAQAVPAPSCARLASAARADLDAEPSDGDADADLLAAGRKFALHHQLAAGAEDDEEADRHLDAYDRVGREMAWIPARTVTGAALKLFVDLILEHGCRPGTPFGIHKPDGPPYGEPLAWSAIADLHRLMRHLLPEEFRRGDGIPQAAMGAEMDGKGRPRNPWTVNSAAGFSRDAVAIRPLRAIGPGDERPEDGPHGPWTGNRPTPITFRTTE
ncbi:MAG TPA: hypothetical protein VK943_03745 [Arenibaculum sp.]|nr:hypothetical protein [Arenibaculum sp.]